MRCQPNMKLLYFPKPQPLLLPPYQSSRFISFCCETPSLLPQPPLPPLFPQLCLKSVYQQAQDIQSRHFSHKMRSSGLLPFLSSLYSTSQPSPPCFLFLPCWIIYLPSWPQSPTLCWYWSQRPQGESFQGQRKTSTPLRKGFWGVKPEAEAKPVPDYEDWVSLTIRWKYQEVGLAWKNTGFGNKTPPSLSLTTFWPCDQ